MKKKLLTVAAATVLTLSMGMSAMAADAVSTDQDYGAEGQKSESPAWNSAANGQFAIEDGQTITFTYDSQSLDTSNKVFGWVSEVTDGTSYFTITQGATAWFAPAGCPWQASEAAGKASWVAESNWAEDEAAYATAMGDAKVELVVTRTGNQLIFESKATGSDGKEYTSKVTGVLETAPEGTVFVQLGSDHGNMTLYKATYGTAGEVEEVTTKEKISLKPSLDPVGVATPTTTAAPAEDGGSNMTTVVVVVVVVLVVAIVAGVLVATKKKKA